MTFANRMLWNIRFGYCYHHVQAIIVAIDQYAEAAFGNREYRNRPLRRGGERGGNSVVRAHAWSDTSTMTGLSIGAYSADFRGIATIKINSAA